MSSSQGGEEVPPLSSLDPDFQVEETLSPPVSEEMAIRICHIAKTPLLPEKLKLWMDRELCPSNTPIAAKKLAGSKNLRRFPTMENLSMTSGKQTGRKSYNHRKSR